MISHGVVRKMGRGTGKSEALVLSLNCSNVACACACACACARACSLTVLRAHARACMKLCAERVSICKEELVAMLDEEELKDAALCVLANKQE